MNQTLPGTDASTGYRVLVDQTTQAEWSELLTRFDDASIYQTWEYGAVCWGEKQLSHLVLEQNGSVVAMAQVRIMQVPFIGSGIAYVRWGPLCRIHGQSHDEEIIRRVILALKEEYVVRRKLMLRVIPNVFEEDSFSAAWKSTLDAAGFSSAASVAAYRTIRVDLSRPLEEIRKGLYKRWRYYLKQAEKNGCTIMEGTSPELYEHFLRLYREMMARKQFNTSVDVAEFKQLQAALPECHKMQIFLCEQKGQVVNALVVSTVGDSPIYLLGATGDAGLKGCNAYLLQWRAMRWLKEKGAVWYDLGGINPDENPGVYLFKTGLGGQEVRQVGGVEMSGGWVNSMVVSCGERFRKMLRPSRTAAIP